MFLPTPSASPAMSPSLFPSETKYTGPVISFFNHLLGILSKAFGMAQ